MAAELSPQGKVDLGITGRELSFYEVDASVIDDAARKLIIDYAGVSPADVDKHVDAVREKAFRIFPYPCIGMYRFLDLSLLQTEVYSEVVERLKGGEKLLDLGCCFGQEIRQLVSDGVPSENCYGSDLRTDFMALGYDLFKDENKLKTKFIAADVFDDNSPLKELYGQPSIVYTGSFFHLFDYEEQLAVARRVVQLLKPEAGSMVVGRQMGNIDAGYFERSGYEGEKPRFRHNPQSWKELWDKIGEETGTRWKTEAYLEGAGVGFAEMELRLTERRRETGARRLRFVVRRQ